MSLDRQLARWQEAGLIDAATRTRIAAFEDAQRTPVVRYALGVLGAGTVALGVVSVIASNWDAIPGRVKLGGDLLIGAALAAATYAAVTRSAGWLGEVLITLFYGFTLASIALVGQVYQLDTPTYQGLLAWSAATAPLVLLGRSRYLAALVVAGLATTHALSLAGLFDYLERRVGVSETTATNLAVTLLFASPLLYVALARVPWLVRNRPEFSRTISALAWCAVLVAGFALQFVWYGDVDRAETLAWSLATTAGLAAAFALALPRLYPDMAARPRHGLAAILGFGWLTLALGAGFARPSAEVVGAILQIAWLGLFAWTSVQLGLVRAFNVLTGLIAVRVLVVYFEVFGSLLSTGVGLITGGALTLLIGWLWRRKTGDLAARLGPSPRSSGHGA
jgi:uncharacterized membrane protein